jgi:ATP-binding protein involved in chromosome partitioning
MAADMGVPFLGAVPIDPAMVPAGDRGELSAYLAGSSAGARAFASVIDRLVELVESGNGDTETPREEDSR